MVTKTVIKTELFQISIRNHKYQKPLELFYPGLCKQMNAFPVQHFLPVKLVESIPVLSAYARDIAKGFPGQQRTELFPRQVSGFSLDVVPHCVRGKSNPY